MELLSIVSAQCQLGEGPVWDAEKKDWEKTADGRTIWGVGIDEDVATASVRAVLSAANAVG